MLRILTGFDAGGLLAGVDVRGTMIEGGAGGPLNARAITLNSRRKRKPPNQPFWQQERVR